MSKPVLGDDPFAPVGARSERPGSPAERTLASETGDRCPPPSQPISSELPLKDGAAARRAARAIASGRSPDPGSIPRHPGPALDSRARPPSLTEDIRRIEERLTRRVAGQALLARRPEVSSFLDHVGQLLDLQTYRRWIADYKMRYRSDTVDEFGYDAIYAERWRPFLEFLYRSYWRVEAGGMENLPDHDRALIVANHAGTLPYDGAMVMCAVKQDHPAHRDVRPLVEDFIFHFPFLGVALNRIGCVRACQENAERLLRHGQLVAVFPEGIKGIGKLYRDRYQLQRFGRGGFIKLALQTRTPIVPTAIIGSEEIHPMLGKVTWLAKYVGIPYVPLTPTFPWLGAAGVIPLPSKWQIRFGEPLNLGGQYGPEAATDSILVNRLTEQVRSTIQSMVDEALRTRRSVMFG